MSGDLFIGRECAGPEKVDETKHSDESEKFIQSKDVKDFLKRYFEGDIRVDDWQLTIEEFYMRDDFSNTSKNWCNVIEKYYDIYKPNIKCPTLEYMCVMCYHDYTDGIADGCYKGMCHSIKKKKTIKCPFCGDNVIPKIAYEHNCVVVFRE